MRSHLRDPSFPHIEWPSRAFPRSIVVGYRRSCLTRPFSLELAQFAPWRGDVRPTPGAADAIGGPDVAAIAADGPPVVIAVSGPMAPPWPATAAVPWFGQISASALASRCFYWWVPIPHSFTDAVGRRLLSCRCRSGRGSGEGFVSSGPFCQADHLMVGSLGGRNGQRVICLHGSWCLCSMMHG